MLQVGRIVKPHGLRGEVIVELFTNREERLHPGATLATGGGPLIVRSSTRHQHRWIVKFATIDDRDAAELLRGTILSADPIEDADAIWIHELINSEVLDARDGELVGKVAAVIANPAGDLIETDGGVLIPLRFVIEHGPGFVRVDPPAGLFEVND